jgi:V8-like Glu-specific endopeptidase
MAHTTLQGVNVMASKKKKSPEKKKLKTPIGAHRPVSNMATETATAAKLLAEPEVPGNITEHKSHGSMEFAPPAGPEAAAAGAAKLTVVNRPKEKLRDIGSASFSNSEFSLEAVLGADSRKRVTNGKNAEYPWCTNASLLITARDGSQWIGTAWFVSKRTLVTAGHCVFIKNSGVAGRDGWVKSIQVLPGRDEDEFPFGKATSTHFHSVVGWTESGDENYDYGAIILPAALPKHPGSIGYAVYPDADLKAMTVNVAGYPGDKDQGTLWYDTRKVASVTSTKVFYAVDTAGGQSGAAVYRIDQGRRIAVAVHAYGGVTTNSGTRISTPVFTNIQSWTK